MFMYINIFLLPKFIVSKVLEQKKNNAKFCLSITWIMQTEIKLFRVSKRIVFEMK